jgi:hypothetical protein
MCTKLQLENLRRRDHLADLEINGNIILRKDVRVWTGFIWLRMWSSGGHCNKTSVP